MTILGKSSQVYTMVDASNGIEFITLSKNGARMAHNAIGRWTVMDPLMETKPWETPYVYCLNNPTKFIDPDGMDEWEVTEDGQIIRTKKTKEHDQFYIPKTKDNTKRSIEFEYGTVVKHFQRTAVGTDQESNKKEYRLDMFRINGDQSGVQLFEFFSNHTNVEWTLALIGSKASGGAIVGTAGVKDLSNVGGYLLATDYTLRMLNHNHPLNKTASDIDIDNTKLYNKKFQIFKLLTGDKQPPLFTIHGKKTKQISPIFLCRLNFLS